MCVKIAIHALHGTLVMHGHDRSLESSDMSSFPSPSCHVWQCLRSTEAIAEALPHLYLKISPRCDPFRYVTSIVMHTCTTIASITLVPPFHLETNESDNHVLRDSC